MRKGRSQAECRPKGRFPSETVCRWSAGLAPTCRGTGGRRAHVVAKTTQHLGEGLDIAARQRLEQQLIEHGDVAREDVRERIPALLGDRDCGSTLIIDGRRAGDQPAVLKRLRRGRRPGRCTRPKPRTVRHERGPQDPRHPDHHVDQRASRHHRDRISRLNPTGLIHLDKFRGAGHLIRFHGRRDGRGRRGESASTAALGRWA